MYRSRMGRKQTMQVASNRLVFVAVILASVIVNSSAKQNGDNEYCIREAFNVSCQSDEIIVMNSARYGRMMAGRCVGGEYGIGCYVDVLPTLDQMCSGRQRCDFNIRLLIEVAQPCSRDLSNYLEASYSCMKVAGAYQTGCDGFIKVGGATGYIASAAVTPNGAGTRQCPWKIVLDPTQRIQLTLFDFYKPIEPFNKETHCSLYAVIEEETVTREMSLCQYGVRGENLYTSITNVASVYFINNRQDRHFMVKYEAVGCPRFVAPGAAWSIQDEDTATVRCNETDETWYLTCKHNTWIGDVGNCTKYYPRIFTSNSGFPYGMTGILVAVIIGILFGAVIGSILLGFVYLCFRKQAGSHAARSRYPNDPPEMTLALRMGDDGKSVYPSLVKTQRPYHTSDYPYGYGRQGPRAVHDEETPLPSGVASNKQLQHPFLSQSSEESDHIYESANFERNHPIASNKSPTVYYELESQGFLIPDNGTQRM